jgi:hypothetical protein
MTNRRSLGHVSRYNSPVGSSGTFASISLGASQTATTCRAGVVASIEVVAR